jgi:uncharacterized protein YbjT (DUF2867 family)
LLTGGTGTLGRLVVPRLLAAGHPVRVLSRKEREPSDGVEYVTGDLMSGQGIAGAVEGIDTIVHCAGSSKGDEIKARNLIRAADGVGHLVNISVVGAERIPVKSRVDRAMFGYFASKRAAELVIERSGVPWTTLRASQFYDLILIVVRAAAKLPVMPIPAGMRFQPVDTDDVAARMVDLALDKPAGYVSDLAGPRIYGLDELARSYLRATNRRRPILRIPIPGDAARAIRAGANLAPDHAVGHRTWEEFLDLGTRRSL